MSGRKTQWIVRLARRIWVRATLFSVGAVTTALLAGVVGPYIPYDPNLTLAAGSVDGILGILAASMLTVTTFSLSITVAAYASAANNVTPRATRLLREDSVAQNTLATFVGSFLFSIVGIIGLAAGVYEGGGRIVLFAATLVVLLVITVMLLRWIDQLGSFGRVGDTIGRIEAASLPAAEIWGKHPRLGACPPVAVPGDATVVTGERTGFLANIDTEALADIADRHDLTIHIALLPGAFVHPARPLAHVAPGADASVALRIADCFAVRHEREFGQDLRFGLVVLSEVASRALSPAVNDPGTAIQVIGAGIRVLLAHGRAAREPEAALHPRLHAPELKTGDLFDDFFNPIARDGAGMVEVQMRLQAALQALASNEPTRFGAIARAHARNAEARALPALENDYDRANSNEAASWLN